MQILWFIDKQFDLALDRATWIEITMFLQKKNDVYFITGYKKNKIRFDDLNNEIIYIDSPKVPFLNRIIFYYNQIKHFEKLCGIYMPEIILFNTQNFFLLKRVNSLKKKYGYKSFLDVRTLPVQSANFRNGLDYFLFKISLKIATKHFDGISYITEEMKNYCQKKFDLPRHKSVVWTSGVDINLFKPEDDPEYGGGDKKTFRLIHHGSIADNRGLDKVIKALSLMRNDNVELFLLGSGNGMAELKALASKLKLEEKVIFHPPVPYKEVPRFINKADIGILPFQDWPGWNTCSPIKLFEYLACGKPVIITRIPAHISVLQGKDFAFWAKKSSPEELARAINEAYAKRKQLKRKVQEARDFVIRNYTWEKQAKKLERFIKS